MEKLMKLLWIDDDGKDRFPYESRKLSNYGYEITWAESGTEAADALQKETFTTILLDQQLPWEKNGFSVVWGGVLLYAWMRGKERPNNAPPCEGFDALPKLEYKVDARVIIVSAFYDNGVAEARRALGLIDRMVLSKPIDLETLQARLKEPSE